MLLYDTINCVLFKMSSSWFCLWITSYPVRNVHFRRILLNENCVFRNVCQAHTPGCIPCELHSEGTPENLCLYAYGGH